MENGAKTFSSRLAGLVLQPLLNQARAAIPNEALYGIAWEAMHERYPEIGADCVHKGV